MLPSTIPALSEAQSAEEIARVNKPTIELEHQKFEHIGVATPNKMEGLSALDFWMAKSSELPIVFKVALNTLPAQASSVSSECVFSSNSEACIMQ
ncbi:hypothetical protein OPQ81_008551 [Rhizoctonia solani]|nr:hypothetical protein OPQ81_008551 [Rhizoctonia solani]